MTFGSMRRWGRATLAVAALALAGCGADPLSPDGGARESRAGAEAGRGGAGESRSSIYVIGSGRGHRPDR